MAAEVVDFQSAAPPPVPPRRWVITKECVAEENILTDADKCQGPVFNGRVSPARGGSTWKGTS